MTRGLRGIGAILALSAILLGCGDDVSQDELERAREEAAQEARQQERIKQLEEDLADAGGQGAPAAPARSTSGGGSLAPSRYVSYSPNDASYTYFAEIPSGNGWSGPVESRPTSGALLRTTVRGPGGTLLIIDRTPSEEPRLGGGFDSSRTVSHPVFGSATEYLISSSTRIPECQGRTCVDYFINDGQGGGWGVLGGGPNQAIAAEVSSRVAQSISFGG